MSDLPYAKKGLGQHWLTDKSALEDIVDAAAVTSDDAVIEIGPGLGTLTDVLLDRGAEVIALEYDSELISGLQKKYKDFDSNQIFIQQGDVRNYDFAKMPENYKIVANIPYYLTANLFRALVDTPHKPLTASLLVQKEVAERITAGPGQLSFVAIAIQNYYEVSLGALVPAHLFTPPPKVDSQVLILRRRTPPVLDVDQDQLFRLVKAGFEQRRKKLKTSLKTGVGSGVDVEELLERAGISPDARAQELSLEDWGRLYQVVYR